MRVIYLSYDKIVALGAAKIASLDCHVHQKNIFFLFFLELEGLFMVHRIKWQYVTIVASFEK